MSDNIIKLFQPPGFFYDKKKKRSADIRNLFSHRARIKRISRNKFRELFSGRGKG